MSQCFVVLFCLFWFVLFLYSCVCLIKKDCVFWIFLPLIQKYFRSFSVFLLFVFSLYYDRKKKPENICLMLWFYRCFLGIGFFVFFFFNWHLSFPISSQVVCRHVHCFLWITSNTIVYSIEITQTYVRPTDVQMYTSN